MMYKKYAFLLVIAILEISCSTNPKMKLENRRIISKEIKSNMFSSYIVHYFYNSENKIDRIQYEYSKNNYSFIQLEYKKSKIENIKYTSNQYYEIDTDFHIENDKLIYLQTTESKGVRNTITKEKTIKEFIDLKEIIGNFDGKIDDYKSIFSITKKMDMLYERFIIFPSCSLEISDMKNTYTFDGHNIGYSDIKNSNNNEMIDVYKILNGIMALYYTVVTNYETKDSNFIYQ
jgi:hypothetical protein